VVAETNSDSGGTRGRDVDVDGVILGGGRIVALVLATGTGLVQEARRRGERERESATMKEREREVCVVEIIEK